MHLEGRVSYELAGMRGRELQEWWCDGFIPDAFEVVGERCRIVGRVWMVFEKSHSEELWDFALYLGPARPRDQIEWATLLPAKDLTGWLSLDFKTKFMKVNPAAARPDAEPAA